MHEKHKISINRLDSIKKMFIERKTSKALSEIEDYLEEYPQDYFGIFLHAQILSLAEDYNRAYKEFEKVSNSNSKNNNSAKVEMAKINLRVGKDKQAKRLLKDVIENSNYDENFAREVLADYYVKQGEYYEAIKTLQSINPENERYKSRIGSIYSILGRKDKIEEILDQININKVNDKHALYELMFLNRKVRRYDEALRIFELLANRKDKYYYRGLGEKAYVLALLGENSQAIKTAQEAIDSNYFDKTKNPYIPLGIVYADRASYKQAKEMFVEALSSQKKEIREDALYRLAKLEQNVNNLQQAKEYFEVLLESYEPKEVYYTKYLSLLIRNKEFKKAESILQEAISKCPKIKTSDNRLLKLIINKHLNKESNLETLSYVENQIMDYSEDKAIEYIKRQRDTSSPFNKNIDIKELFEYTKTKLTEENICYGDILDVYEIEYQNVGEGKNKYRVLVEPFTKNILTMYPHNETRYHSLGEYRRVEEKELKEKDERKQKLLSRFKKID